MNSFFEKLYMIVDKGPFRVLSLLMSISVVACFIVDSGAFAANTSSIKIWQSLAIIWATCTGFIHGVGFKPYSLLWKVVFTPLPAMLILLTCILYVLFCYN